MLVCHGFIVSSGFRPTVSNLDGECSWWVSRRCLNPLSFFPSYLLNLAVFPLCSSNGKGIRPVQKKMNQLMTFFVCCMWMGGECGKERVTTNDWRVPHAGKLRRLYFADSEFARCLWSLRKLFEVYSIMIMDVPVLETPLELL